MIERNKLLSGIVVRSADGDKRVALLSIKFKKSLETRFI